MTWRNSPPCEANCGASLFLIHFSLFTSCLLPFWCFRCARKMAQRIPRRVPTVAEPQGEAMVKKKKTPLLRILHTGRVTERKRKKKEGRAKACPWLPVLVLLVVRAPLVLHGLQHADVETKLARLVLEHLHGFRLWDRVLREEPESGAVRIVLRASDAPGARGPRNLGRSARHDPVLVVVLIRSREHDPVRSVGRGRQKAQPNRELAWLAWVWDHGLEGRAPVLRWPVNAARRRSVVDLNLRVRDHVVLCPYAEKGWLLVEHWHLLLDEPRVVGPRGDVEGLDGVEALGRAVRFLLSDAGAESGRYEKRRGQRQRSTRLLSRKPSAHSSRLCVSSVHKASLLRNLPSAPSPTLLVLSV
mmetsp:Transcript_2633/g.8001  ORF Transcript_2633/g.8001 Transcript_2633/m.8001 type:complete len:358 (-) Transcript_2633:80-1153(-)